VIRFVWAKGLSGCECIEGCQCNKGRVLCQNRVSTNGGSKMAVQALSIRKELALELNESVHAWLYLGPKPFFLRL